VGVKEGSRRDDLCAAKKSQAQEIVVTGDDEASRNGLGALQVPVIIRIIADSDSLCGRRNHASLPQRREETVQFGFGPTKLPGWHFCHLIHDRLRDTEV